jgi:c-di-GMP-binding flagellar brake protein YcgR
MKKIVRPQNKTDNKRTNRRVVMVKSIKGRIADSERDGEVFRAQLVNVSSTGAQIYSNKTLDNNTAITLELDSLDGSHSVTYLGKVVWARKNPMKSMGRFAYGVNFEDVTPEHIKFLETNYSLSSPADQ